MQGMQYWLRSHGKQVRSVAVKQYSSAALVLKLPCKQLDRLERLSLSYCRVIFFPAHENLSTATAILPSLQQVVPHGCTIPVDYLQQVCCMKGLTSITLQDMHFTEGLELAPAAASTQLTATFNASSRSSQG